MEWLGRNWGNIAGVLGLASGIACLVVAVRIYQRQQSETELAHRQQARDLTGIVAELEQRMEAFIAMHGVLVTTKLRTDLTRKLWTSVTGYISRVQAPATESGRGRVREGGAEMPSGKQAEATWGL